jgi:hypothetical protein
MAGKKSIEWLQKPRLRSRPEYKSEREKRVCLTAGKNKND